ncbi:MAG TPA: OmpA family protein [Chromatiales bacterium]|nr:OmpA family protein [Chromatiales bacterium]
MSQAQNISVDDVEDVIEELAEEIHYRQERLVFEDEALQQQSPSIDDDEEDEAEAEAADTATMSSSAEASREERMGASNVIRLRANQASNVLPQGPVNEIVSNQKRAAAAPHPAASNHRTEAQPVPARRSTRIFSRFLAITLAVISIGAATDGGGRIDELRDRFFVMMHEVESFLEAKTGKDLGWMPENPGLMATTQGLKNPFEASAGSPVPAEAPTEAATAAEEGSHTGQESVDSSENLQVAMLDRQNVTQSAKLNDDYLLNEKIWIIPFYVDSAKPRKDKEKELQEIADVAIRHVDRRVYVVGYADSSGPKQYNLALSKRRARNVARALVERGVGVEQVIVEGKGSIETDLLGTGPHFGRRVEVFFEE